MSRNVLRKVIAPMVHRILLVLIGTISLSGCVREPELHLYDWDTPYIELPMVNLQLDIYWNYELGFGINYDWRSEWYYGRDEDGMPGWDDEDRRIFGELEYEEPSRFYLRRYFTGDVSCGTRIKKQSPYYLEGKVLHTTFDWGFWDILAWNDVKTLDGIQSLHFDEKDNLDEHITAYTKESPNAVRYHAPRYQHAFYQPEQLFSACEQGIEINRNLDGFTYDEDRKMWIRKLKMMLEPITYIYLPQLILHNNKNLETGIDRITSVPGVANLSGMARSADLNTGVAGKDAVAVNFSVRMKQDKKWENGETVDIIGGRLMTFGICGQNANRVSRADENIDSEHHYLDITVQFYNGMDSTIVFDVTDQVRQRYKGGVITVELNMNEVPIPQRPGGSGFNAVVKDFEEEGPYEFDM